MDRHFSGLFEMIVEGDPMRMFSAVNRVASGRAHVPCNLV